MRRPNNRKGIILAGGSGSRLFPITKAVSKQLVPIYDKPMVYYALSILMFAGVSELAIITTPGDQQQFKRLLGNGSQLGLTIEYIAQRNPDGIAQAYVLAEDFLEQQPSVMILGDNLFFGHGLPTHLRKAAEDETLATIFGYYVADPQRYGIAEVDAVGKVASLAEKPESPRSNWAVTGLYFLDENAPSIAKALNPSSRGELEILDLLQLYLEMGKLRINTLGRGYAWFDAGTHSSLLEASEFIATMQKRQGLMIGCLEEIALQNQWIDTRDIAVLADGYGSSDYGEYLRSLV